MWYIWKHFYVHQRIFLYCLTEHSSFIMSKPASAGHPITATVNRTVSKERQYAFPLAKWSILKLSLLCYLCKSTFKTYIIVSEVEFSELTADTEVTVGKPLVLTCRTEQAVEECQWTWKSTSSGNKAKEVIMKQFPSFGNDSRDCTIRFDSVVSEQEGVWTCGARLDSQNYFTAAHPVRLSIFTGNPQ